MNKEKNKLILAVVLVLIFIFVVINNFKPKKVKRVQKAEEELNKEIQKTDDKKKSGPLVLKKTTKVSKEIIEAQVKRKELAWGEDPFYNRNKRDAGFRTGLVLTGISIGKDKKGFAIIDGEIVTVDDVIGGYSILAIEKGMVFIEKGREIFYKILTQD